MNKFFKKTENPCVIGISAAFCCVFMTSSLAQAPVVKQHDSVVAIDFPSEESQAAGARKNFAVFKPMPLPSPRQPSKFQNEVSEGGVSIDKTQWPPGRVTGRPGDQTIDPIQILPMVEPSAFGATLADDENASNDRQPQEFGTSAQVFTTSRIDPGRLTQAARFYPFSAAGKLFFNKGQSSFVCSGALIRPGIVVTAAHCVANWGQREFYSNFAFVPGYYNGAAPFGIWNVAQAVLAASYYEGYTANCTVDSPGVVCNNDIAILKLAAQYPYGVAAWAGDFAGWLGYSWNGYGYNNQYYALISELGYPSNLDSGVLMQRTDSQGYVDFSLKINTIIGSLQTGGSSGGPWVLNLGIPPVLSNTSFGYGSAHNMVAAVTSWGYINTDIKQQGASSFTSGNFLPLVNFVCPAEIDECHP